MGVAVAIVAALCSVIAIALISSGGGPGGSDDGNDGVEPALAAPGAEAQAQEGAAGAVLGKVASGDGQSKVGSGDGLSGEAGIAPGAASLPLGREVGPCASPGREGRGPALVAIGILPSPWGGIHVIYYPNRACDAGSRITKTGVSANSPSRGAYAGSQGNSPGGSQGNSPGGSQGSSPGGNNAVGNTVKKPVSGAGNTVGNAVGNTVNNVGNTVNSVGNTVNSVGNTVKGLGGP